MRQVFGGLMMALGLLAAGLSGLCTVAVAGSALYSGDSSEMLGLLPTALMIGGVPFVMGVSLFFAGRALLRSPSLSPADAAPAAPLEAPTMAHPRIHDDEER